jgi:CHAD domain-containing protein
VSTQQIAGKVEMLSAMAKVQSTSWLVNSDAQLDKLLAALAKRFSLEESAQSERRVTYLDTFDWRVWRKGGVLELHESGRQIKLQWRAIDHGEVHAEIPVDECPVFINEIPDWLRPKALLKITRPRALVEQATSRVKQSGYDLRDSEGKVVCRLTVISEKLQQNNNRTGEALPDRLQVDAIRGYEKAFSRVVKTIVKKELAVYGKDPLTRLLNMEDRRPCEYSNRLRLQIEPHQRADLVARQIMLQLIGMMEINEHGIREDLDTEFLHDYRFAIQRAHSLLKQLKQVIPENTRQRFDEDLVWINKETRELSVLNTWLLNFRDHQKLIDKELQPYLDELQRWLRTRRHHTLMKVVQLFNDEGYQKFMKRWRVYLECEVPDHSVLKRAEIPVYKVAGRQIWKAYQKIAAHEDAHVMQLLQNDLLEMGEACTTLEDLLTLTRTLYQDPAVARLAGSVSALHVALDKCIARHNDVQALRRFTRDMKAEGLQEKKSSKAMDMLLSCLQDSQMECLHELQSAYTVIVQDDMHDTYKQLFKKS